MTGPAQIDLGVYSFDPAAGDDPGSGTDQGGGLTWHRLRLLPGRVRRVPPRRWLVVLLVPVLLATVDVPTRQPSLVPLWEAPGQLVASDATAYAVARVNGVPMLAAYHLADGAVWWQQPLPAGEWATPDLVGDVVLLRRDDERGTGSLVAVDAGTGQVRWQRQARHSVRVAEDWLLLADSDAVVGLGTGGLPGWVVAPYEVTVVDLRSGDTAWTGWFAPGEVPLADATEYLLTMQPSGRLTKYDPATGAVLAVAETAPVPGVVSTGPGQVDTVVTLDGTVVSVSGGVLPVATVLADQVIVSDRFGVAAYDPATLRQRWRVDLGSGWAVRCGTLLCYANHDTWYGLDLITGQVRWSRSCGQDLAAGPHPVAGPGVAPAPGEATDSGYCRLLPPVPYGVPMLRRVTADGPDPVYSLVIVDEWTGELDAALLGWRPTGLRRDDRVLMISDSWSEDEAGSRLWLGWWGAEARALELLAPVEADRCDHLTGDYLLCGVDDPRTGDMIDARIWRVGPG